ncbi:MAG: DUF4129 domain-containing protein [Prevotella sp.]|nr:DUF4129 domain-containing protein [Prevotella sp.]MDE6689323.1 DUF4129 domain-containing protein [Prevotella sp.]
MASDTLCVDSVRIAVWQEDGRYDYDREIVGGNENLMEWIASVVSRWLNKTFGTVLSDDVVYYVLVVLGAVVVVALGWLLWKKRAKLFYGKGDDGVLDYEVVEDTIYGVDFDADLREALDNEDYRQAIRLLYLQTLLYLQETGKIDWQPSKTPTQYMRQVGLLAFSQLTNIFVQVRYGNFDASEVLFRQMKALQETVIIEKGGVSHE